MKHNIFLQSDAHGNADYFACAEISIRFNFEVNNRTTKQRLVLLLLLLLLFVVVVVFVLCLCYFLFFIFFLQRVCTDSLINLRARKCLYESMSRGKQSNFLGGNVGINTYPRVSHACMSNNHFLLLYTIARLPKFGDVRFGRQASRLEMRSCTDDDARARRSKKRKRATDERASTRLGCSQNIRHTEALHLCK